MRGVLYILSFYLFFQRLFQLLQFMAQQMFLFTIKLIFHVTINNALNVVLNVVL